MGLLETTFLVLLVLKLIGAAHISWWVVFAPLLISVVLYVFLFSIFGSILAWINK